MKSSKKKVVLLGFKGDCAGRHYNKILIEMALQRKIDLICVDLGMPKNILGSPTLEEMKRLIKEGMVQYIDLKNPKDIKKYEHLSKIDAVFVATPDITHCLLIMDFAKKAKRIFIEKPLDTVLRNVKILEEIYPETNKIIFPYDHYLGKFYPFQRKTDEWIREKIIGEIKKIEFRLLEPAIIPPYRIAALDQGMIYDLFSHGLAVIAAVPSKSVYPDPKILKKVKILKVRVAKYLGCKIKGASYVGVDFEISIKKKIIFCQSWTGKGVGKRAEKFLKITGSKGEIFADIQNFNFTISNSRGKIIKNGELSRYFGESFLSAAIDLKKPLFKIPGVMPFEAAKEILFILDEAGWKREPKGEFPKYPVGASLSRIERIIRNKLK